MLTLALQIQALRLAFTLRLHHAFPRTPEVSHLHPHPPFSQRPQPRLRANCLDISARQIVLLADELIQVDVIIERHLGCVEIKDLAFRDFC